MLFSTQRKGILFDLDGTLLDTAEDLTSALNHFLALRDLPIVASENVRHVVGRGTKGLLKVGMHIDETHADFSAFSSELFHLYEKHLLEKTVLFPGMNLVIDHLNTIGLPWGIVTNKPKRFTDVLVQRIPLLQAAKSVISGDTLSTRKPDPAPILQACKEMHLAPEDCVYIGDAEVDVIAAHAANMPCIVALYGYIFPNEKPETWHANGFIHTASELLALLE